ncbi:MAG: hypothetical protein GKR95_23855 [Gammaproteobacteria bacterium]|nr:hypothetical protein [Gammaproteobacteria bacterium]
MAKKSTLDSKLGSWTDQASLTQSDTNSVDKDSTEKKSPDTPVIKPRSEPEEYHVPKGLIQRIYDAAEKSNRNPNEVVGQLLTWGLDQVDAGKHKISKKK